jgi:hypothetical protein
LTLLYTSALLNYLSHILKITKRPFGHAIAPTFGQNRPLVREIAHAAKERVTV